MPQKIGVAKKHNMTLFDMIRSMMTEENLSTSYWEDALLTVAYVLNCVPTKSVVTTSYELWTNSKPNMEYLLPWSLTAICTLTSHLHGKLGPMAKKCIF